MADEVRVMWDSPEAASIQTVTGWVDNTGRYWGKDERMARYCGSTHRHCDDGCGTVIETKGFIRCDACQVKRDEAAYAELRREDWDGVTPLRSDAMERMFFDASELLDFCRDEQVQPRELQLLLCEASAFPYVESGYFTDDMPEDCGIPDELAKAIDQLNAAIKAANEKGTGIWEATKVAAVVPDFTQEDME